MHRVILSVFYIFALSCDAARIFLLKKQSFKSGFAVVGYSFLSKFMACRISFFKITLLNSKMVCPMSTLPLRKLLP